MENLQEISKLLQKGRAPQVKELVQQALDSGENPQKILEEGLQRNVLEIGEKFKTMRSLCPEVLIAARHERGN